MYRAPDQIQADYEDARSWADYVAWCTGRWPQPAAPGTVVTWQMTWAEALAACTGLSIKCFQCEQPANAG